MNIPILMYHSIAHAATRRFQPFVVSPEHFAAQMAYLYEQGYTPLTVTQLSTSFKVTGESLPRRPVVLTFDDGFADFFTNALPHLQRYGFRATLYIATAFIGQTSRWLRREGEQARPMLSWEQIRQIHHAGIECGGHTHHHIPLDTVSDGLANEEIRHCKQLLEQQLGHPVLSFAYPFGYYTQHIKASLLAAGYTSACTVAHRMTSEHTDPLALTRFLVKPTTTLDSFQQLIEGTGVSTIEAASVRLRTPLWQLVRRSYVRLQSRREEGHICP